MDTNNNKDNFNEIKDYLDEQTGIISDDDF